MKIRNLLFILTIALIGFIGINNVNAEENYGLWVNGEEFTSEKTTINCGEGTATYVPETNTLTLNNATITNGDESGYEIDGEMYTAKTAIHFQSNYELTGNEELYDLDNDFSSIYETLKIVLVGTNVIRTDFYPIKIENANLIIEGTGSLNIKLNPDSELQNLYDVEDNENITVDGNLTIKDVTLTIESENESFKSTEYSTCLGAFGLTKFDNATITMTGVFAGGIDIKNASLEIKDSTVTVKSANIEAVENYEYEYDYEWGGPIAIASTAVTITGESDVTIKGFVRGIAVPNSRVLAIESGNIDISSVENALIGSLNVNNYEGKMMATWSMDGSNADFVTKDDLIQNAEWYSLIKMGDFETYKITNQSPNQILEMPTEAFEGELIIFYQWLYYYNINSITILNANTNEDVTSEVLVEHEYYDFVFRMPAYPIKVRADITITYDTQLKSLTSTLTKYNAVKLTWSIDSLYDYADGYNVYFKKSTDTKWTKIGWTAKKTYTKTGLAQGVKYNFKVVPILRMPVNKKDIIVIESTKYKLINRYTLKKMNTPTVTKYNSKQVRVRWTKVEGATKYQIARSVYKTKNYKTIKTVGSGYIGYKIDTKANKTYYYKVRACSGDVCAPWSDYKMFRLK